MEELHNEDKKQQELDEKLNESIVTHDTSTIYEHIKEAIHYATYKALGGMEYKKINSNFWVLEEARKVERE